MATLADNFLANNSTGKYKWLIYLASLMSASAYTLLLLRWHGRTNWLESLYIFPGYVHIITPNSERSLANTES